MVANLLKIKNKSYFWDDMVYLDDFNVDLRKIGENQEMTLIFIILGML